MNIEKYTDRVKGFIQSAQSLAMCHIFSDSVERFQAGFGPHAKEILADIANYTDLTPVMQISEVVVDHP